MIKTRKEQLEEELEKILDDETILEASKKKEQFDDEEDDEKDESVDGKGVGDAKATGKKQSKLKTKSSDAKKTLPEEDEDDEDVDEQFGDDEDDDEDDEKSEKKTKKESYDVRANMNDIDVSADVDALVEGESDLSEDFKKKSATIFEAAVKSKIAEEMDRIQEEVDAEVELRVEEVSAELSEQVDGYLDYVVENYIKENAVAIETGIKVDIAEGFMSGLKELFEEHYIEVPEGKEDILESVSQERDELEESLSLAVKSSIALKKELVEYKKEGILQSVSQGLTDTEKEKFLSLSEDTDYEDKEQYHEKLATIKESYFKKATTPLTEESDKDSAGTNEVFAEEKEVTKFQNPFARAISMSVNK